MTADISKDELICQLQNQLTVARSEIKNLRQQMTNLRHTHQLDVEQIQNALKNVKCESCQIEKPTQACNCEFPDFTSIGKIESWFVEKRGIPRQAGVCKSSRGVVVLDPTVINNPAYAVDGLDQFSHFWILYHFHKTDAKHVRSKVAPPRLNGVRTGVFSTRSPHRPCPIGLTLVKIDKIADNKIYFSGVDMLDGTPVLDIKPYIPQYDNPAVDLEEASSREVDGQVSEEEQPAAQVPANTTDQDLVLPLPRREALSDGREAPDGEETNVRTPAWVSKPRTKLQVEFTEKGLSQLQAVPNYEPLQSTIVSVLQEDPRSVYLRKKLGNQFYTFLIQELHVSCKFNDTNSVVTVYQVQKGKQDCECGMPTWQCPVHSQ